MDRKQQLKRIGKICLIVASALLVGALLLGVLNGLVADGEWSFGWSDYRYDDSAYQIGDGTVPASKLDVIELDWVDGMVMIVSCEDAYPSLSEECSSDLNDDNRVHWRVSEDGKTLSVKHRSSSYFFGSGKEKSLTLRIPEKILAELSELKIKTNAANVFLDDLTLSSVSIKTESGALKTSDCHTRTFSFSTQKGRGNYEGSVSDSLSVACRAGDFLFESEATPSGIAIATDGGDVTLSLPKDASFTLFFESEKGQLVSDLALKKGEGDAYIAGTGAASFRISTKKGDLTLLVTSP